MTNAFWEYCEGETDFSGFADTLPRRAQETNFRLVVAHDDAQAVGFAMGHDLRPDTGWWDGALTPLSDDITAEHEGRTFAVIELAVLPGYRRRGYARALHAHLLAGLTEERITLLVRPDAEPALRAYERWAYALVGRIQPFTGGPVYDAMIRDQR